MGLVLPVIWLLRILCTIAVILPVTRGSSGFHPPVLSPAIKALPLHQAIGWQPPLSSLSESTASPPENGLVASTPEQPADNSAPPPSAELPHVVTSPLAAEAPHEQPYKSTPPPGTEPLHDSTLPPAAESPLASSHPSVAGTPHPPAQAPGEKPHENVVPVPNSEPGKAAALPPHPGGQKFLPSPLPSAMPSAFPLLPFPLTPPESVVPTQPVPPQASPLPFIVPAPSFELPLILPPPLGRPPYIVSSPPAAEPGPPYSSALPLAAKPPVSSPPVVEPPQTLTVPPPLEKKPFLPSQPPTLSQGPPQEFHRHYPPVSTNVSSPSPQQAPLHASPPKSVAPSHVSFLPPLMMPPPQESPPPFVVSSPPIAEPPPPFVASSPPIAEPLPPFVVSSPPIAKPPHTSVMPYPPIPPHEISPLPQLVPPHTSPTNTFVPPPLARPSPTLSAPQPIESPHKFPPPLSTIPHASPPYPSSPPPFVTPPFATPPLVMPSPASVPLPAMKPPHVFSAPAPSIQSHSSAPTSPAMQGNISAVPPHASQRKETQFGAAPPLPVSPDTLAPKRNPISRGVPLVAPPARAPSRSSTVDLSPDHAPSVPKFERQNVTAHSPFTSQVHPPSSVASHYPSRHFPVKGFAPFIAPSSQTPTMPSSFAPMPAVVSPSSTASDGSHSPTSSPSTSIHKHLHPRDKVKSHSFVPDLGPTPSPSQQGPVEDPNPVYAPMSLPPVRQKFHPPPPFSQVAAVPSRSASGIPEVSPAPSPLVSAPSGHSGLPFLSPKISPSGSSTRNTKILHAPPIRALPPPPPNQDCAYLTCPEPLTNTPPGSPCGCVWPMQVGLRLSVALYTFFPLVSELAREIAAGVFMKQSQVRVMGANAASQEPEKTIVLVDLVPLDNKFDNITAFLTFQRFWHKQVAINKSTFGDYDVLYVRYQGLPPSPPMAPADVAIINGMPYSVGDPNGSKLHPLGVDVPKQTHKQRLSGGLIAAIIFSATFGVLICFAVAWVMIFKHTNRNSHTAQTPRAVASFARSSGPTGHSTGSVPSSSLSFGSSLTPYTGSAKTFSVNEVEKATDNFNPSRVLGEGGFGRVYSGILEDETSVAVKVLKRGDQQGTREFLAEVEMLSRLHHRNLVKLIGICIDERMRCLIYELVPNGSVESHLHGTDKETAPLDWASRMKIALGAARGLAYLHEDSSPRVIHRDFKSSNILLESNFTPKVSDFGLARTAMDEENRYISTRVMGTFGYVAPEYAMTGHLLVKSDVYSYGVVLLELLTGRKPVDMSQPPGQENLVAWTRPLLTSREGLESISDPLLGPTVPFESVAKVAAIASMCVQPEVSHRPFMGEVVQALKLVCNECGDPKDGDSRSHSRENLSMDFDAKVGQLSGETPDALQTQLQLHSYLPRDDVEKGLSVSEVFTMSAKSSRQASSSFRRHSASGPMRTEKGPRFWQRVRRLSQGSVSEHGIMHRLWTGSH